MGRGVGDDRRSAGEGPSLPATPVSLGRGVRRRVLAARPSRRSSRRTPTRSSSWAASPALVRYDNLTSAVKQVLQGRRRVETDRFVALRSHYMFESQFTLIGSAGRPREGRDRGRGRPLPPPAPRPRARLLEASPSSTLGCCAGCEADLDRQITGHRPAPSVRRSRASGRCCERCPRSARRPAEQAHARGSMRRR